VDLPSSDASVSNLKSMADPGLRFRLIPGAEGGVPTLLLHGFTGSGEGWGEGILEGLARKGPVLALDLPGHGENEPSPDPELYTLDGLLKALEGLLDAQGIEAADWVGYSMGARVALAAAVTRPDRIRRLVLESGSPGLRSEDARARRRREDELLAQRIEARGIPAFVDFWMAQPLFATQARLPAVVLEDARRRRLRNDPRALARVLRGLGTGSQPSFWNDLTKVKLPILLLTGALDTRYTGIAEEMSERLPSATREVVPDVGHTVHLEHPRRWLQVVEAFLNRTD
jgi:2-succinyl-6-hydroxy-2,4-cyclohexadiene-1-carboxylate synthase